MSMAHGSRLHRSWALGVLKDEMGTPTLPWLLCTLTRPQASEPYLKSRETAGQEHHALLTSLHAGGMGPPMAVEGATTARVFETYVKRLLAPGLRPGQVVVMDNLLKRTGQRG
jgi:hypothetical protein